MTKRARTLGESLQARRSELGLSQRDLAQSASTTAAAISHIERGVRKPSAGLLARIAGALQCSTDALLAGSVQATGPTTYVDRVNATMKGFSPKLQRQVADFCDYLRHRDRREPR